MEAFDGQEFLLEKQGIKFRLKNDEKKTVIQVSKVVEKKFMDCGVHKISWKKKKTFRSKNEKLARLLMYQGSEIFKYLQSDQEIPKNLIVDFDSQIRKLSFEGKDFLLKSLSKKGPFYFLPSHTNKKYRKKLKIKVDKNQTLKFALGRTLEIGLNNRFITFYELEGKLS